MREARRSTTVQDLDPLDADLASMEVTCPSQIADAEHLPVLVHLSFGQMRVQYGGYRIPVSLRSARLRLYPDGAKPIHKTAIGHAPKEPAETVPIEERRRERETRETSSQAGSSLGAEAGPDSASASAKREAKKESSNSREDEIDTSQIRDKELRRVTYYTNFWKFTDPKQQVLDGIYLDNENPMVTLDCQVRCVQLEVLVECEPDEIEPHFNRMTPEAFLRLPGIRPNRERIAKILLKKEMKNQLAVAEDYPIHLARTRANSDIEDNNET